MIDLSQFLTAPIATTGAVGAAPGAPVEGEDATGFDAVLAQIAALLTPTTMPTPTALPTSPTVPGLPTLSAGFAPSKPPANPDTADGEGVAVAPNAQEPSDVVADLAKPTAMAIPMFVALTTVTPMPTLATPQPVAASDTPAAVPTDAPKVDDEPIPDVPNDALVAAIRVGLGLPSTVTVVPAHAPQHESKALPEHAAAVGRTGVMPTLPEQAHAVLPTPPGIARRFSTMPTADSEKADGSETSIPLLRSDAPIDVDPTPIVMSTETPVVVPTQIETTMEPVNDIAIPDVPVSGQPIVEKPAEDAPVVVPKLDTEAPTELDRLNAIAPPTISKSDDPTDKDDTSDTIVAPHNDDAPPQAAANVAPQQVHATRPERSERVHEANGLAAPLRAALRDRSTERRDDHFEITVRLDPPELGMVRVRVVTQGENVKITLHSDSPEARQVLQQRHDDVKTILRNEGFNLDGFDVETNDERHNSSEQSNRRRPQTPAPTFEEPVVDDGALRL